MSATGIGAPVRRIEDFRFLTGRGTYTDDLNQPNQAHAYILRSPHPHAKIISIDKRYPGHARYRRFGGLSQHHGEHGAPAGGDSR